jgi:hypothetical protein
MTNHSPPGWYVRVTTSELVQGEPVTVLYLAGYSMPGEAEEAVRQTRSAAGEQYQAVDIAIEGRGPQPEPGEVRELTGAI